MSPPPDRCQLRDQEVDPTLDLVGSADERRVAGVVAVTFASRIRHAPVRGRRRTGELRADLLHLVAQRDDAVEAAAGETGQLLGAAVGDVDAAVVPSTLRVRMARLAV